MGDGHDIDDPTDLELPLGDQFPIVSALNVCGVSEAFGQGNAQTKLPSNIITFRVDGDLPGFTRSELEEACMEAWRRWEREIGIRVDKHANPKTDPTQIVTTTRMDGPGGVLADQQLPYGRGAGLIMRIDINERYVAADNPGQGFLNLIAVLCHEDGHCMGMMHFGPDGTKDLMNASYSPEIFVPQPDDVSYGRKLYGPKITVTPPSDKPTIVGKPITVSVVQDGKTWSGTIQRVA